MERKDLADLVHSLTTERSAFVHRLRLMARYPHRLLVVTAGLTQVKSPYAHSGTDPNRVMQSLIACWQACRGPSSALGVMNWARRS